MKIISFDIGIKNLSYVVLEISEQDKYQILEWKVVNLLETAETTDKNATEPKCQCLLKNGRVCDKRATYKTPASSLSAFTTEGGENLHKTHNTKVVEMAVECFCNTHAKDHPKYKMPSSDNNPTKTQLNKRPKEELIADLFPTVFDSNVRETFVKHKQLSKGIIVQRIHERNMQNSLQPISKAKSKANHAKMVDLCKSLYNCLDDIQIKFPTISRVIIENQLGAMATRMSIIQGMITMFYAASTSSPKIEHVSSSLKLKYAFARFPELVTKNHDKNNYKKHKQDAKMFCEAILEADAQPQLATFKALDKKKDDLADCFLQALAVIFLP